MSVIELVGPKGYIHGWIYVGGPGLPSVAEHDAELHDIVHHPEKHSHTELLRARSEMRARHPPGHEKRVKAERNVRHSRKAVREKLAAPAPKPPESATSLVDLDAVPLEQREIYQLATKRSAWQKATREAEKLLNPPRPPDVSDISDEEFLAQKALWSGVADPEVNARVYTALRSGKLPEGSIKVGRVYPRGVNPPYRLLELSLADAVRLADEDIEKHTFERPMVLYRGLSVSGAKAMSVEPRPGVVFTDLAYVSTTPSETIAARFACNNAAGLAGRVSKKGGSPILMRISVPAGTHAGRGATSEFVLARRSRFRIERISSDGSIWDVTILPKGGAE